MRAALHHFQVGVLLGIVMPNGQGMRCRIGLIVPCPMTCKIRVAVSVYVFFQVSQKDVVVF